MRRRARTLLVAAFLSLALAVAVVLLSFPRFVQLPWAVVRHESFSALTGVGSWVYYLHTYLNKMRWNPETGVRDFELAVQELKEMEDPDLFELGKLEWHRGHFAAAVANIERHHEARGESEASLFWLAMSYLRLGEAQNCLERLLDGAAGEGGGHGAHQDHQGMCALPLTVYHTEGGPSRQAATLFTRLLEEHDRDNRLYRWLLNFSYMTVDAFPDEVPEGYRIGGEFVDFFYGSKRAEMEGKYASLKLEDRAGELGVDTPDAGKGVAVEDFDRDGYLDIVTGGSFAPTRYYHNEGGEGFADWGEGSGLAAIQGAHIITAADYDNDGWMDLFISRIFGRPKGDFLLMRNEGDGTFSDQTVALGLLPPPAERTENILTWTSAWGDLENDGDLDLFVSTWAFYNGSAATDGGDPFFNNVDSTLYRNDGDRFVDITRESGLKKLVRRLNIFGAAFGDYDDDGLPDLAITPQTIPGIVLLRNVDGSRFEKTDLVTSDAWGFMTAFVDVNHDGLLDLFVGGAGSAKGTTIQTIFGEDEDDYHSQSTLWIQHRPGEFESRDDYFAGKMPVSTMGSNFGDLDNDGLYDFYLGSGNPEGWMVLPNLMYMGRREHGGGAMDNVSMLNGVATIQKGHGIVFFDFDNDGDQDVYSSLGGMWPGDIWPNQLFVNESEGVGAWTKIRLHGTRSNRYGAGARLRVVARSAAGEEQVRHYLMDNKTGFGSAPYLAHIGLGDAVEIDRVEVRWPGEREVERFAAALRKMNTLRQGDGKGVSDAVASEGRSIGGREEGAGSTQAGD